MHPAPTTLPLNAVPFLPGGPAFRPTMEYPAGMVIQWSGVSWNPLAE